MDALTWASFGQHINAQLYARGEYCGFPIPLPGLRLTVEDRNPMAEEVFKLQAIVDKDLPLDQRHRTFYCSVDEGTTVINSWYSDRLRCWVTIWREGDRYCCGYSDFDLGRRVEFTLHSMAATEAMTLDAEVKAQLKLAELIPVHLFRFYMLSGTFIETSKRSGVTYIFRRGRPTIAFKDRRCLAALCLHPIGYYADTWTGSMVPTDEVIAHLLLMRGDEPLYWRRANQHDPKRSEAGL